MRSVAARKNFAPFSAVESDGSPTPVSSVTAVQRRGAHAHPSRIAATRGFRALPEPASDKRQHELRRDVEQHARLHLSRVIARLREERLRVHGGPPVHDAEEDVGYFGLHVAHDRLELVAAVPVQDHEAAHPLPRERLRDVAQHETLRARVHVDAERNVELPGLNSEWNRRQHDDTRRRAPTPAAPTPRRRGRTGSRRWHTGGDSCALRSRPTAGWRRRRSSRGPPSSSSRRECTGGDDRDRCAAGSSRSESVRKEERE